MAMEQVSVPVKFKGNAAIALGAALVVLVYFAWLLHR